MNINNLLRRLIHCSQKSISKSNSVQAQPPQFVPKHAPVMQADVLKLEDFIFKHKKILVLTGAGISTESGIPDYRSEGVGLYARTDRRPIVIQDFMKSDDVRRRYWARNYVGWPRFSSVMPNATHYALKELEEINKISYIVTQNVDRLHTKAGSKRVIEIHGSAYVVECLGCGATISRHDIQKVLMLMNPTMRDTSTMMRPDGDVELSEEEVKNFKIPCCVECGGILKPEIVFFGGNVPMSKIEHTNQLMEESDALLVLGSSLSVFSGYRIVLVAEELRKPVGIINIGPTRGDSKADLKINAKCGDILTKIYIPK